MLVAVAIASVGFAGLSLAGRARAYRDLAAKHEFSAWLTPVASEMERATPLAGLEGPGAKLLETPAVVPGRRDAGRWRALAAYHRAMAIKYRHASRYPWLPVARDPPLPK